jgi:uncharacterized phage-associated protein
MDIRTHPQEGGHATPSALDVARYLLASQDQASGEEITNLKLQKLLYYAQGYHLALFGTPLFADEIQAWLHGPVVKDVYHEFSDFDRSPIARTPKPAGFPGTAREVLENVLRSYGQYSAWKLREMSHHEFPWIVAYKKPGKTITQESMAQHFRAVLKRPLAKPSTLRSVIGDERLRKELDKALSDVAAGRRTRWVGTRQSSSSA